MSHSTWNLVQIVCVHTIITNTAIIKHISLFDNALIMTNTYSLNSKYNGVFNPNIIRVNSTCYLYSGICILSEGGRMGAILECINGKEYNHINLAVHYSCENRRFLDCFLTGQKTTRIPIMLGLKKFRCYI